MTRVIHKDGLVEPVTLVLCPGGKIVQVKTAEKDGYSAIVVGFEPLKKPRKTKKFRKLKEFKIDNTEEYKVNDEVNLNILDEVEAVKVTGTSKGHGFSGVIKRWNFSRGPMSHGSHHHREPGSIGMCAKPARVMKGKKMPGQHGNVTKSRRNVKVVQINKDKNIVALKGALPGGRNNFITITVE